MKKKRAAQFKRRAGRAKLWQGHPLLCCLIALAGTRPAPAGLKPQPLSLEWGEIYLRTEAQYENEQQSSGSPATKFTQEQTIVEPAVGVGLNGSVYHPNLLRFQLKTELGASWEDTRLQPGGSSSLGRFLQRYDGSVTLLDQKPYATSFYGTKDMSYRDYDFFSRVRVNSDSAGARTGYSDGPVPVSAGVQHYEETEENPTRPRNFRQDSAAFSAQNHRPRFDGATRLDYNLADFIRQDDGFNTTHGFAQTLNLTDAEEMGGRRQARLTSQANYTSLTQTLVPTEQFTYQEGLLLEHTKRLNSSYNYLFDTSSAGDATADTHDGRAGVNYQWLPDFSTGAEVQGDLMDSRAPGTSLETRRYGPEASLQYTPELASWARLTAGDSAQWNHEDRDATGLLQNIIGETHPLTDGTVVLLAQPGVTTGSVHVWGDAAHTISYFEGVDYLLIAHGAFTEIQRVPGGTIANGSVVHVDYTATQPGSDSYDTLLNSANFRLDFWNGLLGFYARWTVQNYAGGKTLLLRTLDDKTVGVDSAWRWFRAGAEYEQVDSNLAPYDRTRFTQSATFHPGTQTTVGLDADEGWTDFPDTHLRQTSYGLIGRLQQEINSSLSAGTEAGMRIDQGDTFDRTLATCRCWVDWRMGKLSVKASYEYNEEYHQADQQSRHYVFVRIRRDF